MAEDPSAGAKEDKKQIIHTYPLIRQCDMVDELKTEVMELCVTASEKFANNAESAAKMIKETLDKKFGTAWHAVVGEGFGFQVTGESKNIFHMFVGGNLGMLVWKCS